MLLTRYCCKLAPLWPLCGCAAGLLVSYRTLAYTYELRATRGHTREQINKTRREDPITIARKHGATPRDSHRFGLQGVTKKVSMRLWLLFAAAHASKWPAPPDAAVDAYVRNWAAGGTARRCGDVGAHGDCSWMINH